MDLTIPVLQVGKIGAYTLKGGGGEEVWSWTCAQEHFVSQEPGGARKFPDDPSSSRPNWVRMGDPGMRAMKTN